MSAPTPIVSVIVVCKNPGLRLRSALASVWAQRGMEPELIVIDGASTDGTREWLEEQRSPIAHFVSEPDRGIYDAMNKAVGLAHGEWVLFLGADDRLADNTALSVVSQQLSDTQSDVAVGEAVYDDGRVYRFTGHAKPIVRNFVHHQATFYRRRLFSEHGPFDASLTIMGDYDFNLRLSKSNVCFISLPLIVAHCASSGLSDAGGWRGYREEIAVRHRHFSASKCWLCDVGSLGRFVLKKMRRRLA